MQKQKFQLAVSIPRSGSRVALLGYGTAVFAWPDHIRISRNLRRRWTGDECLTSQSPELFWQTNRRFMSGSHLQIYIWSIREPHVGIIRQIPFQPQSSKNYILYRNKTDLSALLSSAKILLHFPSAAYAGYYPGIKIRWIREETITGQLVSSLIGTHLLIIYK